MGAWGMGATFGAPTTMGWSYTLTPGAVGAGMGMVLVTGGSILIIGGATVTREDFAAADTGSAFEATRMPPAIGSGGTETVGAGLGLGLGVTDCGGGLMGRRGAGATFGRCGGSGRAAGRGAAAGGDSVGAASGDGVGIAGSGAGFSRKKVVVVFTHSAEQDAHNPCWRLPLTSPPVPGVHPVGRPAVATCHS